MSKLLESARELSRSADECAKRVMRDMSAICVYNPLSYAWGAFEEYVTRYGKAGKKVIFLGMNPGPWGMAQTGVPFGEVAAVRDWLKIGANLGKPDVGHPKYPVDGFLCKRSEVSGKRLWGLFASRFGDAELFFREHFVMNYCPLLFIETHARAARNMTPDRLPAPLREPLFDACDRHLREAVGVFSGGRDVFVVGIGDFAARRASAALCGANVRTGKILHPSPASPASNKDWAGAAARQLLELGITLNA
ncbi:single-strand selective monofunctional uracil DNA glycosylase [Synergistales bacterium]|nr:single-strand selective monofunctional uracil DNA glycosylase [Synergistales bacterium]